MDQPQLHLFGGVFSPLFSLLLSLGCFLIGETSQISCLGVGGGLETNQEGTVLDPTERTEEGQGLVGIRAGELWSREGQGEGWAAFLPLKVNRGDAVAVGSRWFSLPTFVLPFIPYTWGPSMKTPVPVYKGSFHVTDPQDEAAEQIAFYSLCKAHRKLIAWAVYNGAEKPFQTAVIYMLEKTTVLWFN